MPQNEETVEELIYEITYYRNLAVSLLNMWDDFQKLNPALTEAQRLKLIDIRKTLADATL